MFVTAMVHVVRPYRLGRTWVFDDPAVGLRGEAFVCGIGEMLDTVAENLQTDAFEVLFAAESFPEASIVLEWIGEEGEGNWYRREDTGQEVCVRGSLYRYFHVAPQVLHVGVRPL